MERGLDYYSHIFILLTNSWGFPFRKIVTGKMDKKQEGAWHYGRLPGVNRGVKMNGR
jgi:hypothetical protein